MVYAPPIVYSILFLIQLILLLVALSFYLYYLNKSIGCDQVTNIWCWDDWTCQAKGKGSTSPNSDNPCYTSSNMPSCLFGLSNPQNPQGIATNCLDDNNCFCDLTSQQWLNPCQGTTGKCTADPICPDPDS